MANGSSYDFGIPSYQPSYFPDPATGYYDGSSSVVPVGTEEATAVALSAGRDIVRAISDKVFLFLGKRMSGAKVATKFKMLSRFMGPIGAAAALGLTLGEVGALFTHRPKYRRLNPANTKALRRSLRRLDAFAKLSNRVMAHRSTFRARSGRRCLKCRKTSCSC
jgi:hypothetical protein